MVASFQGHRRNGLATSVSSNCTDMMSRQSHYFIQAVNIGLLHVILPAARTWLYLLWKQLFAAGSVIEVKQKLCEQKSLYIAPTLARTSDRC